jgi:hypothetical protein
MDGAVLVTNLVYIGTLALGAVLALLVAAAMTVATLLVGMARLVLSAARCGARTGSRDRARKAPHGP